MGKNIDVTLRQLSSPFTSPLAILVALCAILSIQTSSVLGQDLRSDTAKAFLNSTVLEPTDFVALEQGEPVVRLLPSSDKREIALYGLVRVHASTQTFLQSFRDTMASKSSSAILEIGRFSLTPTLADLRNLTLEARDIEDLKQCVAGNCQVKLSAEMIDRFHKDVDWQAPEYAQQATDVFKNMLLSYVHDYLRRGDNALIEYNDKSTSVKLAAEQHSLLSASRSVDDIFKSFPDTLSNVSGREFEVLENAIVWSKIKFGLKPVLGINHIIIFKRRQESGPQILIVSKQIYANHYFNSSLGLTAFVDNQNSNSGSYLFYENRSRVDGLGGMFDKLKRGMIERQSIDGLKGILGTTRANLALRATNNEQPRERTWREWKIGGVHLLLWFLCITVLVIVALSTYQFKSTLGEG
ncbi:MAG: hypothetical protein ABR555_19035 [Pyrinomonadaceae bacterium]